MAKFHEADMKDAEIERLRQREVDLVNQSCIYLTRAQKAEMRASLAECRAVIAEARLAEVANAEAEVAQ